MPQYLAMDYLTDAICRKQATLSRMLIAWPPLITSCTLSLESFNYRKPWLKGSTNIDAEAMLCDCLKDLSYFTTKVATEESQYLELDGIEYHCSCEKLEEIIPSSHPGSDSEHYAFKQFLGTCQTVTHRKEVCAIPVQPEFPLVIYKDCDTFMFGNIDTNICRTMCECKMMEPLMSVDTLHKNMPLLTTLLASLNVFSITDPIAAIKTFLTGFLEMEHTLDYQKTCDNVCDHLSSTSRELSLGEFEAKSYELPQDYLFLREGLCRYNLDKNHHISVAMTQSTAFCTEIEFHLLQPESCVTDLQTLVDNQCKELEILHHYSQSSNALELSQPLQHVEPLLISNHKFSVSLPPLMNKLSLQDLTIEKCLQQINVEPFQISSSDSNLLQSSLLNLNYMMSLENLPSFLEPPILTYLLPESSFDVALSLKKDIDNINELSSLLRLEPETCNKNLNSLLSWDPVAHAADEMNFVRIMLQSETLRNDDNQSIFSSNCVEDFDFVFNRSANSSIIICNDVEVNEAVSSDIPSFRVDKSFSSKSSKCLPQNNTSATASEKQGTSVQEETVDDGSRKSAPVVESLSVDPLDNFMMLIGKQVKTDLPWTTGAAKNQSSSTTTVTSGKVDGKSLTVKRIRMPLENADNSKVQDRAEAESAEDIVPSKKMKKSFPSVQDTPTVLAYSRVARNRSKKVDVCITGTALDIACMVEKEATPLLELLRSKGLLPADTYLPNINREDARYLLKQQEKAALDFVGNSELSSNLMATEMFHSIVSVFYLIVQVSFTSALALLLTTSQKLRKDEQRLKLSNCHQHVGVFQRCTEKLRVFMDKDTSKEPLPVHPKITELRMRIVKWFRKRKRLNADDRRKALVVCSTVCRYLFMKLCKELTRKQDEAREVERLKPISVVVDVAALSKHDVLRALEENNVLILGEQMMFEDFPWSMIGLLVEYEHQQDSPWKNLCVDKMIKHLVLNSMLPSAGTDIDEEDSRDEDRSNLETTERVGDSHSGPGVGDDRSLVVIGSEKFTSFGGLLHLLETRYEMLVVERAFGDLKDNVHPDLIIDERTCAVLVSAVDLQEQDGNRVKSLLSILTMLRRKFSICVVIVMATTDPGDVRAPNPLEGAVPLNIARIQASVKQLVNCAQDFQVHVVCCFSLEHVAETVHNVSQSNADDTKKNRSWISLSMSDEERFLLHFPCVNSFVAQRLLSVTSLHEICRMDGEQLCSTCEAIRVPRRMAENLYDCLHARYEDSTISKILCLPVKDASLKHATSGRNLCPSSASGRPTSDIEMNAFTQMQTSFRDSSEDSRDIRTRDHGVDPHPTHRFNYTPAESFHRPHPCYRARPPALQALEDGVRDPERNSCFSQFPHVQSRAATCNRDNPLPLNDVDNLLVNAQKKLKEFADSHPDRAVNNVSTSIFHRYETEESESNCFSFVDVEDSRQCYVSDTCQSNRAIDQSALRIPTCASTFSAPVQRIGERTDVDFYNRNVDVDVPVHNFRHPYFSFPMQQAEVTAKTDFINSYETQVHDDRQSFPINGTSYSVGASGSTNIGVAQPIQQQTYYQRIRRDPRLQSESHYRPHGGARGKPVMMTPNARQKMLTFEKVPGRKDGQTRLTFY